MSFERANAGRGDQKGVWAVASWDYGTGPNEGVHAQVEGDTRILEDLHDRLFEIVVWADGYNVKIGAEYRSLVIVNVKFKRIIYRGDFDVAVSQDSILP